MDSVTIQVPVLDPEKRHELLEVIKEALAGPGDTRGLLLLPQGLCPLFQFLLTRSLQEAR